MADLHHQIAIEAATGRVFIALTEAAELRAWWTADSLAEPRQGGVAEFGFMNRTVVFRMRIDEFSPGRRLVWSCVGGPPEWVGTTVRWDLSDNEGGGTTVRFRHEDAHSSAVSLATRNTTWGCLMRQLKSHVEGTPLGPVFAVRTEP
jgi:uncharacterized protein YndB with AHSA1/START domain